MVWGALHSHNRRNLTTSTRFYSSQIPGVSNAHPHDQSRPTFFSPNHNVYLSNSFDPYFNLTLEDWLFRHAPQDSPLLMIYRDSPCVVIGRNQNPWTEVNFSALHDSKIPFIRRRSGGGTVYHDLGNSNFSIHLPRTSFDRHATGEIILRAVRSLGIDARLNDRNDLCVGERKISHIPGSAYKIVNKRAYHHGTMLISSRLETLGDLLRPKKLNILTKGVESVRSPVSNLAQHAPHITHQAFADAVVEAFRTTYGVTTNIRAVDQAEGTSVEYIQKGMTELQSWNWKFGQTPEFTRRMEKTFSWGSTVRLF
ncbi:hypothetical protein BJ165DRAFT_1334237 [Panaeolus papilionaceus]|nr:hypothetical protein BJ165DRAFT_1334237 [Panaeolus papilionaceus]